MLKSIAAVAVMLIAFLAGVPIALVAIAGAAYSLFTRRVKPEKVYREVNWQLLVLFVGLFVLTAPSRGRDSWMISSTLWDESVSIALPC